MRTARRATPLVAVALLALGVAALSGMDGGDEQPPNRIVLKGRVRGYKDGKFVTIPDKSATIRVKNARAPDDEWVPFPNQPVEKGEFVCAIPDGVEAPLMVVFTHNDFSPALLVTTGGSSTQLDIVLVEHYKPEAQGINRLLEAYLKSPQKLDQHLKEREKRQK